MTTIEDIFAYYSYLCSNRLVFELNKQYSSSLYNVRSELLERLDKLIPQALNLPKDSRDFQTMSIEIEDCFNSFLSASDELGFEYRRSKSLRQAVPDDIPEDTSPADFPDWVRPDSSNCERPVTASTSFTGAGPLTTRLSQSGRSRPLSSVTRPRSSRPTSAIPRPRSSSSLSMLEPHREIPRPNTWMGRREAELDEFDILNQQALASIKFRRQKIREESELSRSIYSYFNKRQKILEKPGDLLSKEKLFVFPPPQIPCIDNVKVLEGERNSRDVQLLHSKRTCTSPTRIKQQCSLVSYIEELRSTQIKEVVELNQHHGIPYYVLTKALCVPEQQLKMISNQALFPTCPFSDHVSSSSSHEKTEAKVESSKKKKKGSKKKNKN